MDFIALFYAEFKAVPPKYSVYVAKYVQFAKIISYFSTVNPGRFFAIFAHCARRRGIRNFGQWRMPAQGPARSRAVVIASTVVHATPKEASTKVIGAHEKVKAAVRAR